MLSLTRHMPLLAELEEPSRKQRSLSLARCFCAGLNTRSHISDAEVAAAAPVPSFRQPAGRRGAPAQKFIH